MPETPTLTPDNVAKRSDSEPTREEKEKVEVYNMTEGQLSRLFKAADEGKYLLREYGIPVSPPRDLVLYVDESKLIAVSIEQDGSITQLHGPGPEAQALFDRLHDQFDRLSKRL